MGQYNTREKYDRGVCPLQPPFLAVRGHVLGRIHVRRSFLCFNVLDNEESKGNCKIFNTETLSSQAVVQDQFCHSKCTKGLMFNSNCYRVMMSKSHWMTRHQ